jgi:hypothetical protein
MTKKEAIGALLGVLWATLVFGAFAVHPKAGVFVLTATLCGVFGALAARE